LKIRANKVVALLQEKAPFRLKFQKPFSADTDTRRPVVA